MRQNTPLLIIAFLFGLMGDIFWLGALFFPEETTKFILSFNSSVEYSDLTDEGLTVIRVLIGIMASLIWLAAILLIYIALNYENKSRNWIFLGVLSWFLGDSIISYISNFEMNVIFNLITFIPIAVILYLSKEDTLNYQ